MKFLLKPIFATLSLSLMLAPGTMMAMWWTQYIPDFMPNTITVQIIGTIPAAQSSRYLEEKTAEYTNPDKPPTTDMAQTTKIEIKYGATTDIKLTQRIDYINFNSIKDPLAYIYKRYALSMITLSSKSVLESDIPVISIGHDMCGRPQIYYNKKILTPEPMNANGTLIFRWIQ